MSLTLVELAKFVNGNIEGDANHLISAIASLHSATTADISFLSNKKLRKLLAVTHAGAVILQQQDSQYFSGNKLIVDDPYVAYAKIATLLHSEPTIVPAIHKSAIIEDTSGISDSVRIGAYCIIEENVDIGEAVEIGAGCFIGKGSKVGDYSQLKPNVTVSHGSIIGMHCILHSGVIIGADGFGFANDDGHWIKIPQIGDVIIGDNVDIGANTTIDRGAIENTIIGNGVKLDNQIQIAHNVNIGEHTAIAACTAVAGSTRIGKYCMIGGCVGIVGHLEICDKVIVTGMSMVTKSIKLPGIYSSGTPLESNNDWHKNYVRFKQLDDMARRVQKLENLNKTNKNK